MTDIFRVPMEVTYAIEGGEPALMAYRRWRNISRDDLAVKSGIPRQEIDAGKLLTYAATLDATAIVWIAERFTDEHRKAIDWLNEHTVEDLSLYAVQVELWQIDSSRPALRFSLISQPNEIARQGVAIKSGGAPQSNQAAAETILGAFP